MDDLQDVNANRVKIKEQVERQQRQEYKRLPSVLSCHTATPFTRRKIDESRAKEWKKSFRLAF